HRQEQRDDHHHHADEHRVSDPAEEERLLEEDLEVLHRRPLRIAEGEAVRVEQVVGLLEGGDQHPGEGKRRKEAEQDDQSTVGDRRALLPRAHMTSARRASRRSRMAAAASTGKRNSAIAEAPARSPPSMPLKKAREASTCVMSYGPPRVRTQTTIISVKAKTNPKSTATSRMGSTRGMVIWNMVRKKPAPSMAAASWMSCGIELSPP